MLPDKIVPENMPTTKALKGTANDNNYQPIEPWPEAINLEETLNAIQSTLNRFIVCRKETATAAALWVAMTWVIDFVQVAPLAVITAPEKRCGKSQLLFLIGRMVKNPLTASNITPAALFRVIDAWQPTLLIDESDSFMPGKEELRGLINCGHTRDSAYIVRLVGDNHEPKKFNAWGAKAFSGIGYLPDTIMDRSIVLELRRKLQTEKVEILRHAEPGLFTTLASKLARFAEDYGQIIESARPHLPETLHDRAQDNWEPLLAIADAAGGVWPEMARKAAIKLSGSEADSVSVGCELLADIQEVFDTSKTNKIFTNELIEVLCSDDEKSWSTYNLGKPISPKQVATRLKSYGIISKTIRIGHTTKKGYELDQFTEAFSRYLLPVSPFITVTTSQPLPAVTYSVTDEKIETEQNNLIRHTAHNVTDKTERYGYEKLAVTPQPLPAVTCDVVTDKTPKADARSKSYSQNEWGEI